MPITVQWDTDEHHAIRYDFVGEWGWVEYRERVHKAWELVSMEDYPVCIIVDFSESGPMPNGAIQQIKWGITLGSKEQIGTTIFTNVNRFVVVIVRTFSTIYRKLGYNIVFSDTLEEARQIAADFYAEHSQ